MQKVIDVYLEPFVTKDPNVFLRLARIFHRVAVTLLLVLALIILQKRFLNYFGMNIGPLLITAIATLALATAMNLVSGIKSGVMTNMYRGGNSTPIPTRTEDSVGFYAAFGIYTLALIGEIALIYYLSKP